MVIELLCGDGRRALEEAAAVRKWLPFIIPTIELPATELFLTLRRGQVEATGKLLPDGVEIVDFWKIKNSYSRGNFDNLIDSAIPHDFWTMPGIDWLANAVTAHRKCYCGVSMSVEVLMSIFPGTRTPVDGVEFAGDLLFVKEPLPDCLPPRSRRRPGRPPASARANAPASGFNGIGCMALAS